MGDKRDITIRIAGESGEGVISTGDFLTQAAARAGYNVLTFKTFPAEIKGGHAVYQLRLANHELYSQGDELDILIAFNQEAFDKHHAEIKINGLLVYDSASFTPPPVGDGVKQFSVPLSKIARELGFALGKNVVAVGAIAALFGLDPTFIIKLLDEKFKKKGPDVVKKNVLALDQGFQYVQKNVPHGDFEIKPAEKKQDVLVLSGNQAIGLGALAYGCRHYFGYPITPATDLMEFLATEFPKVGGAVIQAEDEIAALSMAIGASYAGSPAMTATSGPGLSLMVEMLGFAAMAEIPVVVVDVQRGGPSTGLPTKHEQSDLNLACFGGHGDAPRIVVAPISVNDCFWQTINAFSLAERYQMPVILLSDQSLAVRTETIPKPNLDTVIKQERTRWAGNNGGNGTNGGYKRYDRASADGVSAMAYPGTAGGNYTATGLEHDEFGRPKYDPASHIAMTEKRFKKLENLSHGWRPIAHYGDKNSEIGVLGWGSTLGQVREAIELAETEGIAVEAMAPKVVYPIMEDEIGAFVRSKKKILVAEVNYRGQFAELITAKFGKKVEKITRYGGSPFKAREILDAVKSLI